jgi:hypothetical protein
VQLVSSNKHDVCGIEGPTPPGQRQLEIFTLELGVPARPAVRGHRHTMRYDPARWRPGEGK